MMIDAAAEMCSARAYIGVFTHSSRKVDPEGRHTLQICCGHESEAPDLVPSPAHGPGKSVISRQHLRHMLERQLVVHTRHVAKEGRDCPPCGSSKGH